MIYVNENMKNQIYRLAVALTVCDEYANDMPDRLAAHSREIRTCRTLLQKVLDGVMAGLDDDAREYAVAMIKREVAGLSGFHAPDIPMVTLRETDFATLCADTYSECMVCLRTTGEMKNCKKRKILARAQIGGLDEVCRCMTKE